MYATIRIALLGVFFTCPLQYSTNKIYLAMYFKPSRQSKVNLASSIDVGTPKKGTDNVHPIVKDSFSSDV